MMPEAVGSRDIIVHRRGGGVKEFRDTNRAADPLHFVLLHPTGANGWSPDQLIESTEGSYESKRLTCNKYYKYLLMSRVGHINHFLRGGRLLQDFLCMMFSKAEQQRYNWVEMNQRQLRMELYKNVVDHMGQSDVNKQEIGRKVILPATHIGSPRDMRSRYVSSKKIIM